MIIGIIGFLLFLLIICIMVYIAAVTPGGGGSTPVSPVHQEKWFDKPPHETYQPTIHEPEEKTDEHFVEKVLTVEALDSIWRS